MHNPNRTLESLLLLYNKSYFFFYGEIERELASGKEFLFSQKIAFSR